MVALIAWPEGKRFAFSVFDDTDWATLDNVGSVYALLAELGLRTTKSVWVRTGDPHRGSITGQTCDDPEYLKWLLDLRAKGFEIAWHNATWHGSLREETRAGLEKFAELFGHYPLTAANHTGVEESIYWADARLTGMRKWIYNALTRCKNKGKYRGHIEGDRYFWGDLCREKIKYFRNFTYRGINPLAECPFMPYHDPLKPYVNHWFASSDGHNLAAFNRCLREEEQDRLEAEGGACIMYTHFASGFCVDGKLDRRFRELMTRLAKKNGWFVPVATLLDYLMEKRGPHEITPAQRRRLEWKWLREKMLSGTT
jgi:hypothetical protein